MNPRNTADTVRHYPPLALPHHWQADTFTAPDGTRIQYTRTGGDKPPLVLLHGIQCNGLTWYRVAQAFEANYDVLMPDLREHGQSRSPDGAFSLEAATADMHQWLEALHIARPVLMGHSLGADIAARLATRLDTRALILEDPPMRPFYLPMPEGGPLPPWIQALLDSIQAVQRQPHPERLVTALNLVPPSAVHWEPVDYVAYVEAVVQFNADIYRRVNALPYDAVNLMRYIHCPVLLITGDGGQGSIATPDGILAIHRQSSGGHHAVIEGAGHFIHADQCDAFCQAVRAFLASR